jgi:hypothetical protein
MEDFENKSNNEILFAIKQMEADYEALKIKMLKDYDKMEELEATYDLAHRVLSRRLKGEV